MSPARKLFNLVATFGSIVMVIASPFVAVYGHVTAAGVLIVIAIVLAVTFYVSVGLHRERSGNPTRLGKAAPAGALASCGGFVLHADHLSCAGHTWPLAGLSVSWDYEDVVKVDPFIMITPVAKFGGTTVFGPLKTTKHRHLLRVVSPAGFYAGYVPNNITRITRFVDMVNAAAAKASATP